MRHSKHIWRAGIILFILLIGMVAGRHFMIPPTYGLAGSYRYSAIDEFRTQAPVHGGREACKACHEEAFRTATNGKHASLNCEVCHAPVIEHAKVGPGAPPDRKQAVVAPMPKNPTYGLCLRCHQKLMGRPAVIKQIHLREHLEEQGLPAGAKVGEKICLKCHEAHTPTGSTGN